jgi:hypothetical protein
VQGGTSVAFAGVLGGLAAVALLDGNRVKLVLRVEAAVCVPLAILDTIAGDIHGLPFLAGLLLASVWLVRDGARFVVPGAGARAGRGEIRGRRTG